MKQPRVTCRSISIAVLLPLLAIIFGVLGSSASASYNDVDTCRVVEAGKPGPKDDYVEIRRKNGYNGATLLYRDGKRIRFFTTTGLNLYRGWRRGILELDCPPVTVRDIDRITVRVKRRSKNALVIDQSGKGLAVRESDPLKMKGKGGPLAPGARGKGIEVEMKGQSTRLSRATLLVLAGSGRDDRLYLSRTDGITSAQWRSGGGTRIGNLSGFNAGTINVLLGAGDDLMESAGLGPDPSDYGDFYFEAWGGKGDDTLLGHEGRDLWFDGGPGDDLIRGRRGPDRDTGNGYGLIGGPGDDRIFGGPGDDWLQGDGGHDEIWPGGSGRDEVYEEDRGSDVINCESDPLDYIVFDEKLDDVVDCPSTVPLE